MAKEENVFLLNTALNAVDLSQKVCISPIGKVTGIDGRVFSIDENVITNTRNMGIDLVLDKNHLGEDALGWFNKDSLEAKADGIYATLELTPLGKSLVENKSYKYLSPVYDVNSTNKSEVLRIVGVGLVNMPNLLKDALNKQQQGDVNVDEKEYKAQIEELKKQNAELKEQLEAQKATMLKQEENAVVEKIENAVKSGEMLPSRKDSALSLRGAALNNFLDVCKSEASMVLQKNSFNGDKPKNEQIDEDVKKQLGLED